jgi:hypothetical protein
MKLKEQDEPCVFKILERIRFKVSKFGKTHKEYETDKVEKFDVTKLSCRMVSHKNDIAYLIAPFTLEQDLAEKQSLAVNCTLEVHYKEVQKDIFLKSVQINI